MKCDPHLHLPFLKKPSMECALDLEGKVSEQPACPDTIILRQSIKRRMKQHLLLGILECLGFVGFGKLCDGAHFLIDCLDWREFLVIGSTRG